MAYQINLTNGTAFATIADGTLNTSSSMVLVGKNYPGYGAFLDTNFIHLLENAANSTAPAAPLTGQLWFNTTTKIIQVWNGVTWKSLGGATASSSAPTNNNVGDLWFDTVNQQLNVFTGNAFILVGPQFTSATGITGAIPTTLTDTFGGTHTVVQLTTANAVVAVVSKDATFVPSGAGIPGFANVRPGITLANSISGVTQGFFGIANNAQQLNGLSSSDFVRNSGVNQTMGVGLNVANDTGLGVGTNNDLRMSVSSGAVTIQNQTQDGNLIFRVNDGGIPTTVMIVNGATSEVTFPTTVNFSGTLVLTSFSTTGNIVGGNVLTSGVMSAANVTSTGNVTASGVTATGNISGGNLSIGAITKTGSNAVGNIGSASNFFNRVFATATTALYADVAERFAADGVYEAGTVVQIGGSKEITAVHEEASDQILGVISSRAAFLMNGGAGDDDTHPPVAVTGRVPVKVCGVVRKGDRLISAGGGIARAARPGEATAFNTIGRSLEDKQTHDEGLIEAIVMIK
jgi:hypothetical protein